MIRNIVVVRAKAGTTARALGDLTEAFNTWASGSSDVQAWSCGPDWARDTSAQDHRCDYAFVIDLADHEAYARFHEDPGHRALSRDLFLPIAEEILSVQCELPPERHGATPRRL